MKDDDRTPRDPHNVIRLADLVKQRRRQAAKTNPPAQGGGNERMLNLPPVTAGLMGAFLFIHVLNSLILDPFQQGWIYNNLGFIPGVYTGQLPLTWTAFAAPLTFTFIHGSWMHVGLNSVMLMAFGAGIERWMGGRRMMVFFLACSLCAALAQFAFSPFSTIPVVGASGGLSGFFAAIFIFLKQRGDIGTNGKYGLLPLVALWIAISVVFGLIGGPDGSAVAWPAHIGGFLSGLLLLKPILKLNL